MRERFHDRLAELTRLLSAMCAAATEQLATATTALHEADAAAARQVLIADTSLDRERARCERESHVLLAVQSPVATDLRTVLAVVYGAERVERMGDLARHIAEAVVRAHPKPAVPQPLMPVFDELGRAAVAMGRQLTVALTNDRAADYPMLRDADEHVDRLHEALMLRVSGPEWEHGVAAAVDTALLARFYERFADHVVVVARRLDFVITGELARDARLDLKSGAHRSGKADGR